jgi:hypothetical protein
MGRGATWDNRLCHYCSETARAYAIAEALAAVNAVHLCYWSFATFAVAFIRRVAVTAASGGAVRFQWSD